jgi:hypothetical protein
MLRLVVAIFAVAPAGLAGLFFALSVWAQDAGSVDVARRLLTQPKVIEGVYMSIDKMIAGIESQLGGMHPDKQTAVREFTRRVTADSRDLFGRERDKIAQTLAKDYTSAQLKAIEDYYAAPIAADKRDQQNISILLDAMLGALVSNPLLGWSLAKNVQWLGEQGISANFNIQG